MAFTIRKVDPNVPYEGRNLPQDKVPYQGEPPVNPQVPYDGLVLPDQGKTAQPPVVDQTNLPQLVVLGTLASMVNPFAGAVIGPPPVTGAALQNGGVILPADVTFRINGQKVIAIAPILDGEEVTQHIRRRAAQIRMEFTARAIQGNQWKFAQDFMAMLYNKIYLPSSVIYVQNTYFNKRGITQLVVEDMEEDTVRGNINIPCTITFRENIPGKSLII